MKVFVLIPMLCFIGGVGQIYAQVKSQRAIICSPGLSYQGQFFGEINAMYAQVEIEHGGTAVFGPRIGVEANFRDHWVYDPEIGYELSGLIAMRGSMISYIDHGKIDLRILPELGTSLLGAANLTYGYNAPRLRYRTDATSRHRVTFTVNIIPRLWSSL